MALTITGKLNASKSGTTVTNATNTYSHGDMTGDEMHQTVYVSTGATYVTLTAAATPTIGIGSIDVSAIHFILLRNMDDTETWKVSFDAGTTDHLHLHPGGICVIPMNAAKYVSVKASASGVRLEIVAAEP